MMYKLENEEELTNTINAIAENWADFEQKHVEEYGSSTRTAWQVTLVAGLKKSTTSHSMTMTTLTAMRMTSKTM